MRGFLDQALSDFFEDNSTSSLEVLFDLFFLFDPSLDFSFEFFFMSADELLSGFSGSSFNAADAGSNAPFFDDAEISDVAST